MNELKKIAKCQKEFLFNSRYLIDLRTAQQPCDREEFPKVVKRLCKYTGNTMTEHIPDEMYTEDYIEAHNKNLDCMFNEVCKDCEYYDFFL